MSKTLITSKKSITSRDPKGLHAVGLFEAAYNKSELDDERAQRLNERGNELKDGVMELIVKLTTSNQYASEEVPSDYTYPPEYHGSKPIKEQIEAIVKIFNLDPAGALGYVKNLPELPAGAEGWFAIPSVDALATKHFPNVADLAEKYCRAVQLVLEKIAASRPFHNYREGQISSSYLRLHSDTARVLDLIADAQKGDILIIAAQLGLCHRGQSVRRARETFLSNEFGLGSLAVGSIVLTHPERLVRFEELDMDCSGDEFSDAGGSFDNAPIFNFNDDKDRFNAHWVGYAGRYYGSVSAFLPQVS